jgi:hypothetical protein
MAKEKQQAPEEEPREGEKRPKKDRGPLKLLGGVVGVVGLGAVLALVALPGKPDAKPRFHGPFHHQVFAEQFTTNVQDNSLKRFLKTNPQVEYFAYDESYLATRTADVLYEPWLEADFGALVAGKLLEDIFEGVHREQFAAEIAQTLTPVLFPVHIGDTKAPLAMEPKSGLRHGNSYRQATFRGKFHEHVLKVDGPARTVQINDGPLVTFVGNEEDLQVLSAAGESIYLDVTEFDEDFQGELELGVHGRIRQVFITQHLAQ